ncbi:hypothetical protein ABW20_dc0104875 [Dactylellina cionopaga]|nr:hypothetical protein ABW20_dc0104875 [Dactylellina cionopaga]
MKRRRSTSSQGDEEGARRSTAPPNNFQPCTPNANLSPVSSTPLGLNPTLQLRVRVDTEPKTRNDYTVGWICALSKELTAATAMLDGEHASILTPESDDNTYTLGHIGEHNIVIVCLPLTVIGTNQAARVATLMFSTFPRIKIGLMVGIGGGLPSKVKLGDVVVSTPSSRYPGVVQWDFGKAEAGGFIHTGALNKPPNKLLSVMSKLQTKHQTHGTEIPRNLEKMEQRYPRLQKFSRPPLGHESNESSVQTQEINPLIPHNIDATSRDVPIHYGLVASGNQVIKNANVRDGVDETFGGEVLCVEMEAAGLMDFPCIVIRGICDYADEGKNKDWQEYAAAVAAAFAKEFLESITPSEVDREQPVMELINKVHDEVAIIRSTLSSKDDLEILNWLTPDDYGPQHSDFYNRRQAGTGQWLLDNQKYQNWRSKGGILFCHGIPGAGKTILTSIVIEDLKTWISNSPENIGIAYLYCNFKQESGQKIGNLLASLLKQLAQRQSSLPPAVKKLHQKHKYERTRPSEKELTDSLQIVASTYSRTLIIIDALDECHCQAELLSELFKLQEHYGACVFATSRPVPDILDRFKENTNLEILADDEDVRKYLDGQIATSGKRLLLKYREYIKDEITKKVCGM